MDSVKNFEGTFEQPESGHSINDIISGLNDLGLLTLTSCSGIELDNVENEDPWIPFVTMDVETPIAFYHLFTIADMAGWNAKYGMHGLGVELRLSESNEDEIRIRWDLLLDSAKMVIERIQILGKGRTL